MKPAQKATMPQTAAEWIQAATDAVSDELAARSGFETLHGPRFRAEVCQDHHDCVWARFDSKRLHVRWKEQTPEEFATSLLGN